MALIRDYTELLVKHDKDEVNSKDSNRWGLIALRTTEFFSTGNFYYLWQILVLVIIKARHLLVADFFFLALKLNVEPVKLSA